MISSITVTYNPEINTLNKQIKALVQQVGKVFIIDNNSKNIIEIQDLVSQYESIDLIILDENKGIAYAQNIGIKEAKKTTSTHVILFDQDSEISDDFIPNLLKAEKKLISKGEKIGAVGPCFYNETLNKYYSVPIIKDLPILKGLVLERKVIKNDNEYIESYFLIASGCLIRLSVIDDVGEMDSSLFIDNVDLEWCFRAQIKGYKVFTCTNAKMVHRIGDGIRQIAGKNISIHSNIRKYYNTRNNLFLLKYDGLMFGLKLRIIPFLFVRFLIGLIDTDNIKEYMKYYYYAIKDFIFNKRGKYSH